tara:strand:- start:142 stop:1230 length:1089 start_codon:yes stop_codon:yes gene_type:complete
MVTKINQRIWVTTLLDYLAGGCAYQLYLNSPPQIDNPGKLMPGYIESILGDVYHKLYDEIRKGEHRDSDLVDLLKDRAERKYTEYVDSGKMMADEKFTSLEFINDTNTKARNLERVRGEISLPKSNRKSISSGFRKMGREVYIDGFGGRITGKIDEVKLENNQVVIIDDKTSVILQEDGEVKPNYRLQVIIYALLWSEKWEEEVSTIKLRSRSGNIIWSEHKSNFKSEYTTIKKKINELSELLNTESANPENLATPSGDNCNFCNHRIDCVPHRKLENKFDSNNPGVFRGELERIFPLGPNKFKLTIKINGKKMQTEVNKNWCEFDESESLPINVRLHAFWPHSKFSGKLNARNTSHFVSIV